MDLSFSLSVWLSGRDSCLIYVIRCVLYCSSAIEWDSWFVCRGLIQGYLVVLGPCAAVRNGMRRGLKE